MGLGGVLGELARVPWSQRRRWHGRTAPPAAAGRSDTLPAAPAPGRTPPPRWGPEGEAGTARGHGCPMWPLMSECQCGAGGSTLWQPWGCWQRVRVGRRGSRVGTPPNLTAGGRGSRVGGEGLGQGWGCLKFGGLAGSFWGEPSPHSLWLPSLPLSSSEVTPAHPHVAEWHHARQRVVRKAWWATGVCGEVNRHIKTAL